MKYFFSAAILIATPFLVSLTSPSPSTPAQAKANEPGLDQDPIEFAAGDYQITETMRSEVRDLCLNKASYNQCALAERTLEHTPIKELALEELLERGGEFPSRMDRGVLDAYREIYGNGYLEEILDISIQ